ncbi:DUF2306 domain-containing protein [Methylosinus sp. H3A]|uniref:DUF2306 domain-containing protein n=1 Tax=Methylosinus sp. H3A TaxID=2785786 RepID=UPI0018C20702|nr:DUF2306 domain-containing protein [Methylosinus sp. H3A]MBG0808702.1 DUF2306 domain-containing protein [Methylosinus sp. H3A]
MDFQPLATAPPEILAHVAAVAAAILLAPAQFVLPKGTPLHKSIGRAWVGAMIAVCASSFFILDRPTPPHIGGVSWLHLLAVTTLALLWRAVRDARRGRIRAHRIGMACLALLGIGIPLVVAFAVPGRIMHRLVFE